MKRVYFITSNDYKMAEYSRLFRPLKVDLSLVSLDLTELQTMKLDDIVLDKVARAYRAIHHPLIVEHCSLSLNALGGLPEGFTKPFWHQLKNHICDIVNALGDRKAVMKACLSYCDGKKRYVATGVVHGTIAKKDSHIGKFHLDRVFIPDGNTSTLSQMTKRERDLFSPRRIAVAELMKTTTI